MSFDYRCPLHSERQSNYVYYSKQSGWCTTCNFFMVFQMSILLSKLLVLVSGYNYISIQLPSYFITKNTWRFT